MKLMQWMLLLFGMGWSIPVMAVSPSFDCAKARLPVEVLICGDENLSRLDGAMGRAYSRKKKEAGADQEEKLRQEQRQWLADRLERCGIPDRQGAALDDAKGAVRCLEEMYQGRIGVLNIGVAAPAAPAKPEATPRIEWAKPRGETKQVRQVTVRFTHPMVPLGDPRLEDPFIVQCPAKGKGRWVDGRNWVYDFEQDLSAGLQCSFQLKDSVKSLDGLSLSGERNFSFSTGGPEIIFSQPWRMIEEDQVFLLGLDAPADPASIEALVHCQAGGIAEKIEVRVLSTEEVAPLIQASDELVQFFLSRGIAALDQNQATTPGATEVGNDSHRMRQFLKTPGAPIAGVQCKRRLPPGSDVSLIWSAGVRSRSGVARVKDQVQRFKVREPFLAELTCGRVNKDANCLPLVSLEVNFNAPVLRAVAEQMILKGPDVARHPVVVDDDSGAQLVTRVYFPPPFPEKQELLLELPTGFKDDSGRELENMSSFPMKIVIDEMPPLAKFPAQFGIIEAASEPALPVTVRHLESIVAADPGHPVAVSEGGTETAEIRGRIFKVTNPVDFPAWIRRIDRKFGDESVFSEKQIPSLSTFVLPKPNGAKEFEVMGIPLPGPGFYVVELASHRLGAALHGQPRPYYVQAAALVTNLAGHFFHGRESSLVWVTALDSGRPVAGAEVTVSDCSGKVYAQGTSDGEGRFFIQKELPQPDTIAECSGGSRAYLVTSRLGEDVTFVMSDWNKGIQSWQFDLPGPMTAKPHRVYTILDRSLFRAGETVHMKHLFRRHERSGFAFQDRNSLPTKGTLRHAGGTVEYPLTLSWDATGVAESRFEIPKEARLGTYEIMMDGVSSGSFRVEAFRVPLMRGVVKPVAVDLVDPLRSELDVQVNYLAGGAAGHAPIRIRGMISPREVTFPGYEEFTWANGAVEPGRTGDGEASAAEETADLVEGDQTRSLPVISTQLDAAGGGRVSLEGWKKIAAPKSLLAEMEYRDPNGEILVSSARMNLWPSPVVVGIKSVGWIGKTEEIRLQVATLDPSGKPREGLVVRVDLLQRKTFSHRKRLLGGFYSYDHHEEVTPIKEFCSGKSDALGRLFCEGVPPGSGNLILQARVVDEAGHVGEVHDDLWVHDDSDETWFHTRDGDRMDLVPEKRRYEPGEEALLQARLPFQEATALVVVAREGVMDTYVQPLSRRSPRVSLPILGHYGPNVFVAVMAVRGRSGESQPTALVDLGRPSLRLGMTQLEVGYRDYELKVGVGADRTVYKTRESAEVTVVVHRASGKPLPPGGEIALAAVDEGLLELLPNGSWQLLEHMMAPRGMEVEAATGMGHVVGRRHFGKKALPHGGGGGRGLSRELFDTLLFWQGRIQLDADGRARAKIPLNDSITSFRIVAVATAGADLFGTGETSIRVSRDVVLFSGLPPLVRAGDRFQGGFTIRNAGEKPVQGKIAASTTAEGRVETLPPQEVALAPGEAREVFWDVKVPDVASLSWEVVADMGGVGDRLKVQQEVIPAVAVRVLQTTLSQLENEATMAWAKPEGALPGRGGVGVSLTASLASGLTGVISYMRDYPYTCMEQRVSRAIALEDLELWGKAMAALPSHLDSEGLVKFFPQMSWGSESLTSYLLAVADEARWTIPDATLAAMKKGLLGFVEGRIRRDSGYRVADSTLRRVAAMAALSRYGALTANHAGAVTVDPAHWPTSTVLDWIDLLNREPWPDREASRREALDVLRTRMNFSGGSMRFSTENGDYLWWLMVSPDVNANRAVLTVLADAGWKEDVGRMMRGSLSRQRRGHWNTSVANAWGTLAVRRFSEVFEKEKVSGTSTSSFASDGKTIDWSVQPQGGTVQHPWSEGPASLVVHHEGKGKPWLMVESRAAVMLTEPLLSGYQVKRTVTALERQKEGEWHRGDLYRVRLELDAQADMSWVVVMDPVPAGSVVLGSGLGKDSRMMTAGEQSRGWVWPAMTERTFDSYRVYYEWVPKGGWQVEYTVRLNTAGTFQLPPTRVEAMYSPEIFSEVPNDTMTVLP
ncbi:MAG: DUF1311 domain-containing protein [Magnetococcales bacterium]|nr:DUF1311 domain-containing protein [Magnetococcales bacterium]